MTASTLSGWSAAADPARRVGHAVEAHQIIGSTNDRARALLHETGVVGVAVVAERQTAGRGRRGRTWLSPAGLNLMVSVALRSQLHASDAWQLSAAAALAVQSACASLAELAVRWPNDLVVPTDGRKVAGLLVETALEGEWLSEAVIGVGINVNWRRAAMPPQIAAGASALIELHGGVEVDRVALLGRLLAELDREFAALDRGASPLERYRAASWLDGRQVHIAVGSEALEGRARGISDAGELVLVTAAGELRIGLGEVVRVEAVEAGQS